jgi:transcriptional regulator with XRE-family HTH domain
VVTSEKKNGGRSSKKAKPPLAQRLKRAAQGAGFTSESLSERLGVTPGAVRSWWTGRNEPSVETLKDYAAVCRVSIHYLITGDEPVPPVGTLQEWQLQFANLVRQGMDPAEAIDRITGMGPGAAAMTAEERASLTGSGAAMREVLEQHSGGRWEELTDDQRHAVLLVIQAMAKANRSDRPPSDEGASG